MRYTHKLQNTRVLIQNQVDWKIISFNRKILSRALSDKEILSLHQEWREREKE